MQGAGVSADQTYPEDYIFDPPISPHAAAEQKGTTIELRRIRRPASPNPLIVEGAGGVLVPVGDEGFMLDLMRQLGAPVIVAARTALGTINHTLLTVAAIRNTNLDLRGVVMIGKESPDNRRAVERYGNVPVIGSIPWLEVIDRATLISVFEQHFDPCAFV